MAKVRLNPSLLGIRGRIGELLYRKNGDATSLGILPQRGDQPPTPAQQAVQDKFKAAARYAKHVMADPVLAPLYTAAAKEAGLLPRAFAIRDFLHAPDVEAIDAAGYHGAVGDVIKVTAVDDFDVASVTVTIRDAANAVLEQGAAVLASDEWRYVATTVVAAGTPVAIEAVAKDRPGNSGQRSVVLNVA